MVEAAEANARPVWNEAHCWERTERWRQRDPIDLKDIWKQCSRIILCSHGDWSEFLYCGFPSNFGIVPQAPDVLRIKYRF